MELNHIGITRLIDLLYEGILFFAQVKCAILDEAMADMHRAFPGSRLGHWGLFMAGSARPT